MLISLSVRDLAVIESAELEPGPGFTVLTGETGAGKSLLVDALGLVLGDRGAAALVRAGAEHADVTAEFSPPGSADARTALEARGLSPEDPLILQRKVGADGRSRAWINGIAVPLGGLRDLAEGLVEIHGQNAHLALARPAYQRGLLDAWAGTQALCERVAQAAAAAHAAATALEEARAGMAGRAERLDFIRFQLHELDELQPRENEYGELLAEYDRLRHRERTAQALAEALALLEEGEAPALDALAAARQVLARLPAEAGLGEAAELLTQSESLATEAVAGLRRSSDAEADPGRVEWLNARIARYQALARKHAAEPAELADACRRLRREAEDLDEGDARLARLQGDVSAARRAYDEAAAPLSTGRAEAAPRFAAAATAALQELGMPRGRLEVVLEPEADAATPPGGRERIRFEATTNAGQAPGPLSKVASGGELSRLALAVEVLAGTAGGGEQVLIFDEVDAGVSGRVAELVGRRLKALAARRQVLCVTHLPQVAALADRHYAVTKTERKGASLARVERLDAERRVEALAAMLAGLRVTETARSHARELIARAADGES